MTKKQMLMMILMAAAFRAEAATAFWTGQQRFAQSVTGMPGFQCQYQFAGKTFWAFFTGSCPPSIEVE